MACVMVVDDDVGVREVLASYLGAGPHQTIQAGDGEEALRLLRTGTADLIVLDLMLPGIDGLELIRRVRSMGNTPIIMLSARGSHGDRVAGLELGADDYVSKPFSPRELVLRVDTILRRIPDSAKRVTGIVEDGDLVVDGDRHLARLGDDALALTAREFALLWFLVTHPGTAYTHEELLRHVWRWTFGDISTVMVHVRRLRVKVEPDPTRPTRLVTVWGIGYRWEPLA
jgi:DNA-binding response OmpR family regulator